MKDLGLYPYICIVYLYLSLIIMKESSLFMWEGRREEGGRMPRVGQQRGVKINV